MTIYPTEAIELNCNLQMDKAIELRKISKRYPYLKTAGNDITPGLESEGFWAVRDVSLDVAQGEMLGIIGRNGAGKTTLLNIIAGVLSATQGEIIAKGKVLGLFNLGVGFQDELTGKENIFLNGAILGASKKELDVKLKQIIEFSELGDFINMPLGTYSQGMRLRLGFSIVTDLDFDILVIDEVLAVGDALFQDKCFKRLMDFRRSGKTLIITSQSMDLIERLCDKVALLDHGHLLFYGDAANGINRYRALLNTEKFFVGPALDKITLIENTKKWADDISDWGKIYGTKEVVIDSLKFKNRFGFLCRRIKSGNPLKIRVNFTAKNKIKEAHFGVAIFRNDGVYCYGPNTKFDGYEINKVNSGRGWFEITYKKLLLAPGEYRFSVAIWDKNEVVPFDHHYGFYKFTVIGHNNAANELLNLPIKHNLKNYLYKLIPFHRKAPANLNPAPLLSNWGEKIEDKNIRVDRVEFLGRRNKTKNVFMTNEFIKFAVTFSKAASFGKNLYFWFGIYRDDGVCCQTVVRPAEKNKSFSIEFPKFALLPGGHKISFGIWDYLAQKFIICHHGIYPFGMVFNRQDHGTVYLEHKWEWRLP